MYPLLSQMQLTSGFDLDQFLSSLQLRGMTPDGIDMVEQYIRSCWDKGVDVVLDPNLEGAFGTYDLDSNTLTLGQSALDSNIELIETLEHEFIHVLQDEMAGIHNSEAVPLGLPTTEYGELAVENGYSHLPDHVQELEVEAHSTEELFANPETDLLGLIG